MDDINNFFDNSIVSVLVGPIIVGVVVLLIGYIARNFWERRKIIKQLDSIKIAETKFVDLVRPFFLKRQLLTEDILNDIRDSIIKEYYMDKDSFMTLNDLRKNLIYDICNTRYIDEDEKYEIMKQIKETFIFLKENDEEISNEILKKLESKEKDIYLAIFSLGSGILSVIITLINENEKLRNIVLFYLNNKGALLSLIVIVVSFVTVFIIVIMRKNKH